MVRNPLNLPWFIDHPGNPTRILARHSPTHSSLICTTMDNPTAERIVNDHNAQLTRTTPPLPISPRLAEILNREPPDHSKGLIQHISPTFISAPTPTPTDQDDTEDWSDDIPGPPPPRAMPPPPPATTLKIRTRRG
jgi:hypothetical protein